MVQPYVAQPSDFVPFQPYMVVPRILPESKDEISPANGKRIIEGRSGSRGPSLAPGPRYRTGRDSYLLHHNTSNGVTPVKS